MTVVAFVCDWLTGMRGGERCLEVLCELYPDADIFTLVHEPGAVTRTIESHRIRTSYIQKLPGSPRHFRKYLALFPHAIETFDLSGYDCVISLSHCVAKSVKTPAPPPHICYCHTPMRYAWYMREEYLRNLGPLQKYAAGFLLDRLKRWDRQTAERVTHFIANSRNVQQRIRQAYGRDSTVIYPPVDCDRFDVCGSDDGYYLIVSALVPYKRVDLAVRAFSNTDRQLVVVGNGPETDRLKGMVRRNITFVTEANDEEVAKYLGNCRAFIFPGEEDFGIVPLEAQASGKAVIAYAKGGSLETVVPGVTGVFFYDQTESALLDAIERFESNRDTFDPQKCRENAMRFDRSVYKKRMRDYIGSVMG